MSVWFRCCRWVLDLWLGLGVDLSSGFGVVDFGWRFWVSAFGLRCLLSGFDSVVCGTDTDCVYMVML